MLSDGNSWVAKQSCCHIDWFVNNGSWSHTWWPIVQSGGRLILRCDYWLLASHISLWNSSIDVRTKFLCCLLHSQKNWWPFTLIFIRTELNTSQAVRKETHRKLPSSVIVEFVFRRVNWSSTSVTFVNCSFVGCETP